MTISDIIQELETIAPVHFQESYDNSGLIIGNASAECSGAIVCLDAIEAVVDEAINTNCNLIIAHHPIIFRGLKKIAGNNYIERIILRAIKNDIAIYAVHTNLDNIKQGVNGKIAEKIGLQDLQILQPKENILKKLITFAPVNEAENIRKALFNAGAGHLGKYSECSFNTEGTGTFKPEEGADPHTGEIGERHEGNEIKIEVIFPGYIEAQVIRAMIEAHPYEEVAYDVISLGNYLSDVGSGLSGELDTALDEKDFLAKLKSEFGLPVVKHACLTGKTIKRVAICGGSGSFLIPLALKNKVDAYVTADIKYHDYFDAEEMFLIDIGHYESEQFTIELLYDILREKYPNFAVRKTQVNTNPVHYYL